jgi:hypothetical protein
MLVLQFSNVAFYDDTWWSRDSMERRLSPEPKPGVKISTWAVRAYASDFQFSTTLSQLVLIVLHTALTLAE